MNNNAIKSYSSIIDIPNFMLKKISATHVMVFLFSQTVAVFKIQGTTEISTCSMQK